MQPSGDASGLIIPKRNAKRKVKENTPKHFKLVQLPKSYSPTIFHSFAPAISNIISTTISKEKFQRESGGTATLTIANLHRRPEIAAVSGALVKQRNTAI